MSKQEIGPRERALREMREANFAASQAKPSKDVGALREKVASIPARKARPEKRKKGRKA